MDWYRAENKFVNEMADNDHDVENGCWLLTISEMSPF